ncbi:unnamed protein product [Closterium sp. NIES-64]|nr:unnamed protein product [Closterium sp. NIES-64]
MALRREGLLFSVSPFLFPLARFALVGLNSHELVNVKLALSVRLFLPSPSGEVHCCLHNLQLVRSELPYMRFGFMLWHIVDESSPLHGLSLNDMLAADTSFSLTISGLERTTMQPVFVVKVSQCSQVKVSHPFPLLFSARFSALHPFLLLFSAPVSSAVLCTRFLCCSLHPFPLLFSAPVSSAVLCTCFLCCSLHPFPLLFSAPVSSAVLCTRFLCCSLHPFPLLFSAPVSSAVLCARFTCSSLHPFPLLFSAPSTVPCNLFCSLHPSIVCCTPLIHCSLPAMLLTLLLTAGVLRLRWGGAMGI